MSAASAVSWSDREEDMGYSAHVREEGDGGGSCGETFGVCKLPFVLLQRPFREWKLHLCMVVGRGGWWSWWASDRGGGLARFGRGLADGNGV